jgi:hypothetical protein
MIFVKFNMPSENSSCRCFVCKFVQFEIEVFSFLFFSKFNYFLFAGIDLCNFCKNYSEREREA